MSEEAFRPCPFCGGQPELSETHLPPRMSGPGALVSVTLPHAAACATITLQNKSEHLVVVGGASGAILLPGGVYEVGLDGAVTVTQRSEAENPPGRGGRDEIIRTTE